MELGQLEGSLRRDVWESLGSSQALARAARTDVIEGELVEVGMVAVLARGRVAWDMGHGLREDMIEVSTALAIGSMEVDVMEAERLTLEMHMDWIWGHC